jgi:hypothetical protein
MVDQDQQTELDKLASQFSDGSEEDDFDFGRNELDLDDFDPDVEGEETQQQQQQPVEEAPTTTDVDKAFNEQQQNQGGFYDQDNKGNLVDKQGNIVAAAGKERKEFTKLRDAYSNERGHNIKLAKSLVELTRETKSLWNKYKQLRDKKSPAQEFGLNTNEEREAMQIASLMKADPKAAIERILTVAQMRGMDISSLGVGNVVDPATIAREVAQIQANETRKAQEAAEKNQPKDDPATAQARAEIDSFLSRTPAAYGVDSNGVPLTHYLGQAKARYPHLTLDQIWTEMTKAAQQPASKQNGQQSHRGTTRPVGRRQTSPRRQKSKGVSLESAHPSTSFDDIAKDLLRDIQADEG